MLTIDVAADIVASGIKVVIILVCVLVVPSLLVGMLVSIFQAVTQINEQTLSFYQANRHPRGIGYLRKMDDRPVERSLRASVHSGRHSGALTCAKPILHS